MILSREYLDDNVKLKLNEAFESMRDSGHVELASYDVFLSYSWNDREYAAKVEKLLKNCGYTVYVDYNDTKLDRRRVTEATAKRLVEKMKKCRGLLYLYSPNSSVSKWCPWEVGVFSGIKDFKCANLPLVDKKNDEFKGQEYLELYPYVDYVKNTQSIYDFWICDNDDDKKYVSLKGWLNGVSLRYH